MAIARLDPWVVQDTTIDIVDFPVSAGTDRLLVVCIGAEDNSAVNVTGMTYGGQTMFLVSDGSTDAKESLLGGGSDAYGEMWACLETEIAAASGTTIDVTLDNSSISEYYITAGSYEGVDQSGNGSSGSVNDVVITGVSTTIFPAGIQVVDGGLQIVCCFSRDNTTFTSSFVTEQIDANTAAASIFIGDFLPTTTGGHASTTVAVTNGRGVILATSWVGAAGSTQVTLDEGSYALTGNAIGITRQLLVNLDEGAYALTGHDITITKMVFVELDEGAYSLTGNAIGITRQLLVNLDEGAYTLTGNPIDIQLGVGGLFMATKGGLNGISVGGPFFKNPLG